MAAHGLKLILDFVPNHVGLDHPWTRTQPSFLIPGSEDDIQKAPRDWCRLPDGRVFAHGRDPNYPGWPDTLQLNYFNPDLREAMVQQLIAIAKKCDGVRC
jgi:glycosidase